MDARGKATTEPAYPPLQEKAAARPYSSGGNQRESVALIEGTVTLSPVPSRARTRPICHDERGNGVSVVKSDHQATPHAKTRFGPQRSARMPAGIMKAT